MKHFLIVANRSKDKGLKIAESIRDMLLKKGAVCYIYEHYYDTGRKKLQVPEGTECVLVIGGDGTMLGVADQLFGSDVPILGINLGTLGFLTEVKLPDVEYALDLLMKDEYKVEHRFMLRAHVIKNNKVTGEYRCLNDFIVSRGLLPKLLTLEVKINGTVIDQYHADGLILCTPTGSTGYNLSAGGPIINPTCRNFVLTPICPHSLTSRSVVLSKNDVVEIELMGSGNEKKNTAVLSCDVAECDRLEPGDRIKISGAKEYTPFIKMEEMSFVTILKDKLL